MRLKRHNLKFLSLLPYSTILKPFSQRKNMCLESTYKSLIKQKTFLFQKHIQVEILRKMVFTELIYLHPNCIRSWKDRNLPVGSALKPYNNPRCSFNASINVSLYSTEKNLMGTGFCLVKYWTNAVLKWSWFSFSLWQSLHLITLSTDFGSSNLIAVNSFLKSDIIT